MGILFEVKDLSMSFKLNDEKSLCVLNELNFSLPNKGLFCIFGKSGCGKSTLLNILEGLMKPTKGQVLYKGKDLIKFSEKDQKDYLNKEIGVIFQSYNLLNDFTVYDNLRLALKIKGINDYSLIDKYLESYKLSKIKNKKVQVLSGGEKQRIAIIRSLLNNPDVIFADEPTGNLDHENSILVMENLKEISKSRLVIMVSHNKELIEKYNDGYLDLTSGKQLYIKDIEDDGSLLGNSKSNKNKSFLGFMLLKSFKRDFKQNLLSLFAIVFAFLITFVSIGFNNGIVKNSDSLVLNFQNFNSYKVSKIAYESITDSNLKLEKTEKPSYSEVENIVKYYKNYEIKNSFEYFFGEEKSLNINNKIMENVSFIPVNNLPNSNIVYVNNAFKNEYTKHFSGSCLNRILNLNLKRIYSYNNKNPIGPNIIEETFEAHLNFDIERIKYEFSYLNYPKIYFSYSYFENFLKNYKCTNINNVFTENLSFYDLLNSSNNYDDISNYSYLLFLDNKDDVLSFNKEIKSIKGFSIQNEANTVVSSFKELSSTFFKGVILFIAISIICVISIVGFLSFSSYIFNRKQSAILTILGAKSEEIFLIYIIEKIIVTIIGFIISIISTNLLTNKINQIVFSNFYFKNILFYPFSSINLNLIILILGLFLIFLTTYIPLLVSRKNEIYKELKEE